MADRNDAQLPTMSIKILATTPSIDKLKAHLSQSATMATQNIGSDVVSCCIRKLNDVNDTDMETDDICHNFNDPQNPTNGGNHTNAAEQQQQTVNDAVRDGPTTSAFRSW